MESDADCPPEVEDRTRDLLEYVLDQIPEETTQAEAPEITLHVVKIKDDAAPGDADYLRERDDISLKRPSRLLAQSTRAERERLRDQLEQAATWLADTGLGWPYHVSRRTRQETPESGDKLIQAYVEDLWDFILRVVDYEGSFDVSEDAYQEAFRRNIEVQYADRVASRSVGLVAHASGLDRPGWLVDQSIDNPQEVPGLGSDRELVSVRVRRISEDDLSTIEAYRADQWGTLSRAAPLVSVRTKHVMEVVCAEEPFSRSLPSDVFRQGEGVLRLLNPSQDISIDSLHHTAYTWITYRTGIWSISSASRDSQRDVTRGPKYDFDDLDKDTESAWRRFHTYFSYSYDHPLEIPIERFEGAYKKRRPEDRLLDCIIALEASLLRGVGPPASYRFRLPLRASLLLSAYADESRDAVYAFFRDLYDLRGALVHDGKRLHDIEDLPGDLNPHELIRETRRYVGLILRAYLEAIDGGVSIDDVNRSLDKAAKGADADWRVLTD